MKIIIKAVTPILTYLGINMKCNENGSFNDACFIIITSSFPFNSEIKKLVKFIADSISWNVVALD